MTIWVPNFPVGMDLSAPAFPDFFHLLRQHVPDRLVRKPRKLTPAQLLGTLCLMTGFGRKGYRRVVAELQTRLHHAFGWSGLSLIPSPQAIGQARRSLSRSVCDLAFDAMADNCPAIAAKPVARYGSYRLLTSELEAVARQATAGRPRRAGQAAPETATDDRDQDTTAIEVEEVRFNRLIIADNVVHLLRHAALGGRDAIARELPDIISFLWKNRSYAKPGRSFPRLRKRSKGHFRASGE